MWTRLHVTHRHHSTVAAHPTLQALTRRRHTSKKAPRTAGWLTRLTSRRVGVRARTAWRCHHHRRSTYAAASTPSPHAPAAFMRRRHMPIHASHLASCGCVCTCRMALPPSSAQLVRRRLHAIAARPGRLHAAATSADFHVSHLASCACACTCRMAMPP